jgi:hypothetical protein
MRLPRYQPPMRIAELAVPDLLRSFVIESPYIEVRPSRPGDGGATILECPSSDRSQRRYAVSEGQMRPSCRPRAMP